MISLRSNNSFNFTSSFGAGLDLLYDMDAEVFNSEWKYVINVTGYLYKTFINNNLECRLDFLPYRHERSSVTRWDDYITKYTNKSKSQYIGISMKWNFKGGKNINVKDNNLKIQDYKVVESMQQL